MSDVVRNGFEIDDFCETFCRASLGSFEVMQMPLFDMFCFNANRVSRRFRQGLTFTLALTAISAAPIAFAGEPAEVTPQVQLSDVMESSKLRMEARLAAEQGDFLKAAKNLEMAALKVGDRATSATVAESRSRFEAAGGGAQPEELMNLIQLLISPDSWLSGGGEIPDIQFYSFVNPAGVFVGLPAMVGSMTSSLDNGRLLAASQLAQTANVNTNVREASDLRLVSLPRLEQHLKKLTDAGLPIPEDVACLAGLTEVQFLFVFPETNDIVIGGPAGDWQTDESGRILGTTNGRPTLRLDDLVTLSRTFSSGGAGFFMCSIDPKPEQVKAVREYAARTQLSSQNIRKVTDKLEDMLGLQNVVVQGIPQDSRVASVIVEADYQMKLIGIGEREGAEGMKSYFDLLSRAERKGSAMDALRWWMTVGYDSIQVSPDKQAFEFSGREVQCQSENQLVGADGSRQTTGKADSANAEFARLFTEHLPALSSDDVVFADLQNIFDLSLATALVHTMGLNRQIGWHPEVFAVDGTYTPESVEVPAELMTAASSRVYRGGEIVIQVAGGIRGDFRSVVRNPDNFEVSAEMLKKAVDANPVGQSGRWWWDAAAR